MILAAEAGETVRLVPVPGSFDGITTALVLFILACMLFPRTIKNRSQFYMAFGVTLLVLAISTLRYMLYDSGGMQVFGGFATGIFQIGALVLLFLSAGGLSVGQFADEMKEAIEVVRRGGEAKEIIVPMKGEVPRGRDRDEPPRKVYTINDPPPVPEAPPPASPGAEKKPGSDPLPME